MPFAVFRQHQRKLLAVFAILAMIGFVLSDTLPRWMNSGGVNNRDLAVAEIYGKKIHLSDLARMNEKRQRANRFMYYAGIRRPPAILVGRPRAIELIDALILDHEADRLNIPSILGVRPRLDRPERTNGVMTPQLFEGILARYEQRVGGEQLLGDIASQVRIALAQAGNRRAGRHPARRLPQRTATRPSGPRSRSCPIVVDFLRRQGPRPGRVGGQGILRPSTRTSLPDPASPTPGFKVPRQVKAEFLSVDRERGDQEVSGPRSARTN